MKNLSLLFFALFASFAALAQVKIEDLEQVNELWTKKGDKKPYTGEYSDHFDNGNLKYKGYVKKGLSDGLLTAYHPNGNKALERYYAKGLRHGTSTEYYPSGQVRQEATFKNDKEDGTLKVYHDNGQVAAIFNFTNGIKNGEYVEYFPDGRLKTKYYFTNDQPGYSPKFQELAKKAHDASRAGHNDQALAFYDQAIQENPTVSQAYFNRAACKALQFNFEAAIADYDKAIEINPNYAEAYANRGNTKINTFTSKGNLKPTAEQTQSACEDFHKSIELGGNKEDVEDMIYIYCKKQ